jgi:hypothetical protein
VAIGCDNLSLQAWFASTFKRERIWHFQTVHHDVWDRDNPAARSCGRGYAGQNASWSFA